jgi:hypothetical protein
MAPYVIIDSPTNTTYNTTSITLNVSTSEQANVTYSLNGTANVSLYNSSTGGNTTAERHGQRFPLQFLYRRQHDDNRRRGSK